MENQFWDKAKLAEWKAFWESDIGQEYLEKLEDMKTVLFTKIMNGADKEMPANLAGRAAGVEIIIQDIEQGINAANEQRKEDLITGDIELDG